MEFDVVIVGGGLASLSAAIRLKQVSKMDGREISVLVVEKGSEIGAHILSGAVIDPIGLDALIANWRDDPESPLATKVEEDAFLFLTKKSGYRLPNALMPKLMDNHGNYIGSLGNVARFLAKKAEELEVEIFPGFAATEILYDEQGRVAGVATGDLGIGKDGSHHGGYTRGVELRAKYTLFGEGARGSLTKQLLAKFNLAANSDVQKFGIGIKELWQVKSKNFRNGLAQHSFGWPLDSQTGGGSFLYHFDDNLVSVGFVVHLNYSNPTLSPFGEFQRFKTHPRIRGVFEGAKRISYGARALTEGGWQSVPKLTFPGGALIGCAAGFVNVPRIKGSHNAILSGIQAADAVAAELAKKNPAPEFTAYDEGWRASPIGRDLKPVRNVKPLWSRYGTPFGIMMGALDMWTNVLVGKSFFGTLLHGKPDYACLKPLADVTPITYPKPDGVLTFDRLSSVFLSNTNHAEDQRCHLTLKDASIPISSNLPLFGEPARLYCPAAVYEVTYKDENIKSDPQFVINAQNCVHCKTCDIKDPAQNINWVPPEGGGGPNYPNM
ncbi:electron transfer flavoprotein-ubiquinone oxidoreductase [Acetobacter sp. AN02]|uniref:electron transfer flavoprotein-ubiquinone oxidoreductase n=1 Tax=Acetobacter sp. AN02 TaxID=2894186 RepID=UPI00243449F5|nr:electron transfer flavoprotein-ubiquinone oxidoreductase [Acetobacter sp. AN02]MDG6095155.1 electron transfer flavoprotein-ubiquinone oxidoreductase [Acetobacter sp. AN02]